jgi:Rap1a immunity proteins
MISGLPIRKPCDFGDASGVYLAPSVLLLLPLVALAAKFQCEVMMKRFLVAVLLLFPGIVHAEYFESGNDLWGLCTDKFPGHEYLCLGLPTAYFDMMLATGYQCAATGVAREQVRDAVFKYLVDNPDKRNQPASQLALTSLKAAFQCVEPAPVARPTAPAPRPGKPKGPVVLAPNH